MISSQISRLSNLARPVSQRDSKCDVECKPSKAHASAVVFMITEDPAGANGVVHKDSTEFLEDKSACLPYQS
jgi:hypothetical protein